VSVTRSRSFFIPVVAVFLARPDGGPPPIVFLSEALPSPTPHSAPLPPVPSGRPSEGPSWASPYLKPLAGLRYPRRLTRNALAITRTAAPRHAHPCLDPAVDLIGPTLPRPAADFPPPPAAPPPPPGAGLRWSLSSVPVRRTT
jgi:hypothetical protein